MANPRFGHGRWLVRSTLLVAAALLGACTTATPGVTNTSGEGQTSDAQPVTVPIEIVARYAHDRQAFTQGLLIHQGQLFESTGLEGRSEVRRVDLASGQVLARRPFPRRQFGEGLAAWRDQLVGLTWMDGTAHRWRVSDLAPIGSSTYEGEGWGLTTAGGQLVQSNGSAILTFRNPETFAVERQLTVRSGGRPLDRLNELEFVDGRIWANVWMTPWIAVIDPADGRVTHMIDLGPLVAEAGTHDLDAVANGIAWDAANRRLYVTGKLWPTLYRISVPALGI